MENSQGTGALPNYLIGKFTGNCEVFSKTLGGDEGGFGPAKYVNYDQSSPESLISEELSLKHGISAVERDEHGRPIIGEETIKFRILQLAQGEKLPEISSPPDRVLIKYESPTSNAVFSQMFVGETQGPLPQDALNPRQSLTNLLDWNSLTPEMVIRSYTTFPISPPFPDTRHDYVNFDQIQN